MYASHCIAGIAPVEGLENRLLFAYTSGISAGVLTGNGDATSESIVVSHVNVSGTVYTRVSVNGVQKDNVAGIHSVVINGNGGSDLMSVSSTVAGAPRVTLNGNDGQDRLTGNSGHDELNGGDHMDEIFGGAGDDLIRGGVEAGILVGGDGNDDIFGGAQKDVLIGGNGADELYAGDEQDLLVAGRTSHDTNWYALEQIQAEWRSGHTYNERISFIQQGTGLTQGYKFNNTTVFRDNATDLVDGGAGRDWFFTSFVSGDQDYFYNGNLGPDEAVYSV